MKLDILGIACMALFGAMAAGCGHGNCVSAVGPSQGKEDKMSVWRHTLMCGPPEDKSYTFFLLATQGDASRENFEALLEGFRELMAGASGLPFTGIETHMGAYDAWVSQNEGKFGFLEPDTESPDECRRFLAKGALKRIRISGYPDHDMSFLEGTRNIGKAYYIGSIVQRMRSCDGTDEAQPDEEWVPPPGSRFEDVWDIATTEVVYPAKDMTLEELCGLIAKATKRTFEWYPEPPPKWDRMEKETFVLVGRSGGFRRRDDASQALEQAVNSAGIRYARAWSLKKGKHVRVAVIAIPTRTRIFMIAIPSEPKTGKEGGK